MNRGAWQATVHGVARVRYDLATKPPPPSRVFIFCLFCLCLSFGLWKDLIGRNVEKDHEGV